MKYAFRIKHSGIEFFAMISSYQTLTGITSLLPDSAGLHMPMFDIEDCSPNECVDTLTNIQKIYGLSNIYILSDNPRSFRAICYSAVNYKTFLRILLDTDYLDESFFDSPKYEGYDTYNQ